MTFIYHLVWKLTTTQHISSVLKAMTLQDSYLNNAKVLFPKKQEKKVANQATYKLVFL